MGQVPGCPLCDAPGGIVVFQGFRFRLIRAHEAGFPAFYRLVWERHVAEFSDLPPADRLLCMEAVFLVERALRNHLQPIKVNLASLGNSVAHLHWHIVARFEWDSHFPAPVWAAAQNPVPAERLAETEAACPALDQILATQLGSLALNPGGS